MARGLGGDAHPGSELHPVGASSCLPFLPPSVLPASFGRRFWGLHPHRSEQAPHTCFLSSCDVSDPCGRAAPGGARLDGKQEGPGGARAEESSRLAFAPAGVSPAAPRSIIPHLLLPSPGPKETCVHSAVWALTCTCVHQDKHPGSLGRGKRAGIPRVPGFPQDCYVQRDSLSLAGWWGLAAEWCAHKERPGGGGVALGPCGSRLLT